MNDLQLKIKLENRLKPKLRTFFRNIASEVQASLVAKRIVPDLSYHNRDMASLLREHYRAVTKAFRGRAMAQMKKSNLAIMETKQVDEDIDAEINQANNKRSEEHAALIMKTTENQLQDVLTAVSLAAAVSGTLSNEDLGKQVRDEFIASNANRVDTIAMTETNGAAEDVKEKEAIISIAAIGATFSTFKTWNTNLDEKTRLWHAQADLQKVRVNQPFIVKGQQLMKPGDTSLGATLDNIINCRCGVSYSIE